MAGKNIISFTYDEFENINKLEHIDKELVLAAREIASKAHAPYSKFRVGAAVRLESGAIVLGANVENAASPSGICAESNAISNSVVNNSGDNPLAIAIAAMNEEGLTDDPVPPCGNCRQIIAEVEFRTNRKIKIILSGKSKFLIIDSIHDLLPMQFNLKKLKINLP